MCNFIYKRKCLKKSYAINQKCGDDNICSIRTSSESHIHWNEHFHKNPLSFRSYADFEADNEINKSTIVKKNN